MHRIYNNISLAYKAKKLTLGTEDVVRSIKKQRGVLIFVDSSASVNTFKIVQNKVDFYGAKIIILDDVNDNLSKIFNGKQVKVMAVKDKGFKDLIYKNIEE